MSGDFLPIQLIYQGEPTYPFPREFYVTQTESLGK